MSKEQKTIARRLMDQWPTLTILGTIIALGFGGGMAWSNQKQTVKSLEARVAQVEDTQNKLAGLSKKMFEFTMNLWNIDPDTRKKWKDIPMTKPDSIICGYEWTEFKELTHWFHYRYQCDSLKVPTLQVDTLYVFATKKDEDD